MNNFPKNQIVPDSPRLHATMYFQYPGPTKISKM